MARTVATILSYGMGVESSAILLRWVMNPATRQAVSATRSDRDYVPGRGRIR